MQFKFCSLLVIIISATITSFAALPALATSAPIYLAHYDVSELEGVEKAIRANPNDAGAYLHRGLIRSHSQEDFEGAIADFSRAIELDPDRAETYNYRGTSYFWLKQFQKALADYNRALDLDPKMTLTYYNRGYVRIELGDEAGAIEDFRQGAALSKQEGDTISEQEALKIIQDLEQSK